MRPTKLSLAHQTKTRTSIIFSAVDITNKLKSIQNQTNKSENDLRTLGLIKRTGAISKHSIALKRRKSLNKKLSAIVSCSSMDNSTSDGETLKQLIVASLTENVKKLNLIDLTNKENYISTHFVALNKDTVPIINNYLAERIVIEQIEHPYKNYKEIVDNDDEPIDPSYVIDYIADIMNLLYTLEKKYLIKSAFLTDSTSTAITVANGSTIRPWKLTAKHRCIVVGWIIQLIYARFHLSQDAMHICIGLLDRFLQQCMTSTSENYGFITQKNLQLIAVATFLIAAKIEETHYPPVEELVYITDYTYTSDQIKRMERKILHELRFEINRPTSLQFLRRFSFISTASDEQHAIGKFLIDLSLLDVSCIDLSPSLLAASATYIARYILNRNQPATFEQCWPQDLQMRSPYKTYESLSNSVRILARCIHNCLFDNNSKEHEILIKRYENEQLLKVSLYCIEKRTLIHDLANESSEEQ